MQARPNAIADSWFTPGKFAALLALFIIGAFPKVVAGLETFFYRDFGMLAYPVIYHHHESFWRGELPLWNPLSNCGAPFLAQWGTLVLYPFSLFYLLLPLPWSLNFFCLAHLFLGGLGMYCLAARWVEHRFAASVAGLAFVLNGVTFSCFIWPNYLVALGWMPWVVLWVERSWREGGRCLMAAAIIATLQMMSGVPEVVLLTWLILLALGIDAFARNAEPRKGLASRFGLVVLLVSGLISVQLWPFLDLLAHSQRDPGFATSKWAMPAWGWAQLLVPLFRCFLTPQGIFFQVGQEFMTSTYLGVTIVALALFAVTSVRQSRVWILGGLALFGLIMALGENGVLYSWIRRALPLVGFARYPIKFVVLAAFALPLLAAYAIRSCGETPFSFRPGPWRRLLMLWLGILIAIAAILWVARAYPLPLDQWPSIWRSGLWRAVFLTACLGLVAALSRVQKKPVVRSIQAGIIVLLGLDALTHVPSQNPTLPSAALAPGLWELSNKVPPPKPGAARVMISPRAEQHLLMSWVPNPYDDLLGKRLALWSHLNLLEGISKINGSSTLQLREQMQVQSLFYASTNTDLPRLADFLGAAYTTAPGKIVEWTPRQTHLPLVTVGQKPIFADATNTLSALTNADFNPAQTVYLPLDARPFITVTNQTEAKILSYRFTAHRIEVEVEAKQPSLLVIAQSYYHPWRGYVDGSAQALWRANHAFQALEIPAGQHQVILAYEDRKFRYGALVSCVTLLLCGIVAFPRRT
jgi:hypothetical protein